MVPTLHKYSLKYIQLVSNDIITESYDIMLIIDLTPPLVHLIGQLVEGPLNGAIMRITWVPEY